MAIEEHIQQSKRNGAETLGALLQIFGLLIFGATIFIAIKVNYFGKEIGFGGATVYLTWMIVVTGLVVSAVLAGLGYALSLLTIIYDRQAHVASSVRGDLQPWPRNPPIDPPPFKPGTIIRNDESRVDSAPPVLRDTEPSAQIAEERTELDHTDKPTEPTQSKRKKVWEWLNGDLFARRPE